MKIKVNSLTVWPYVHVCPLDISCWMEMWLYGAPMQVTYCPGGFDSHGPGGNVQGVRTWTFPVLSRISDWRHDKMWASAVPVEISRRVVPADEPTPPSSPEQGPSQP